MTDELITPDPPPDIDPEPSAPLMPPIPEPVDYLADRIHLDSEDHVAMNNAAKNVTG